MGPGLFPLEGRVLVGYLGGSDEFVQLVWRE